MTILEDIEVTDLLTRERLEAAGFEPDTNVCARCGHPGGEHDLNNWCLTCPRPDLPRRYHDGFTARMEAGWDYFSSMTKDERWAYSLAKLRDAAS